jgi:SAM-dependent methyltransferase
MSEPGAEFWDAHADTFDEEPDHGLRDPDAYERWQAILVPLIPQPASRVADLGCGTGTLSLLLASAGHQVTGVDFSPRMIALARQKADATDVRAEFVIGDAASPPLADASVNVVLSRHVLWAMTDPGAAVDRWLDLLAPGGVLVLVEGRWATGAGLSAEEAETLVLSRRQDATVTPLTDPALWGGPIDDERYLLVSRR